MDYGEILTKAWKIIWKYKILWLFGIFASCSSRGSGSSFQISNDLPPSAYYTFNNTEAWIMVAIGIAVLLLALFIIILVVAVSTFGRVALIQGTVQADKDENAQITFGGLFNSMKPFFWRVLGVNILIGLGFFVIIMAIVFIVVIGSVFTLGLALFCLIPLICMLIPVFWVLLTFVEMANVAIVVDDLSITDGIRRGWDVFRDHLGEMLLMGLILIAGGFIVSMILAIPFIATMFPLMFGVMALALGNSTPLANGAVVIAGLCCVSYLPILIILGGIVRAYLSAAWTLTYLRLTEGVPVAEPVQHLPDLAQPLDAPPEDTEDDDNDLLPDDF